MCVYCLRGTESIQKQTIMFWGFNKWNLMCYPKHTDCKHPCVPEFVAMACNLLGCWRASFQQLLKQQACKIMQLVTFLLPRSESAINHAATLYYLIQDYLPTGPCLAVQYTVRPQQGEWSYMWPNNKVPGMTL